MDNTKDEPDRTATVTATLGNSQGTGTVSGATLTLTDNDAAPGVTLSVASSPIPENGGSTSVSATLTHPSSAATTVTVTPVSGSYTVSSSDATITIAAGETANATDTAAIAAVDNDVDAADNAVTVTGTAQNSQGAGTVTGASLTITDDDTAGFAVSPATSTTSRLRTTEDGGTDTFTVKLGSEPTGDVVLGVASSDTTEGTVSASSLTFTATTWSTAQTVTLTGVDDAPANPADGDQDYTVTLTVNMPSTVDPKYDALSSSPVTVYAVNADNEHGLKVSSVTGQATEAGGTATFTVALMTRPLQAVTVTVTSRDAGEGTVSPSSLTFETSDWNTTQAVTATGVDDAIDDGDVTWGRAARPVERRRRLQRAGERGRVGDDDRRRRGAGGDAGGVAVFDLGERGRGHGDGDAVARVGRGDDGDGDGGLRLLHGGLGRGDRDRGGADGERDGHGDGGGGQQHHGRAGSGGHGDGDDHERPGHGRRDDPWR